jgi:hypothetical protein
LTRALARGLFQFDDFTEPVLAEWTLEGASKKTGLIWLDAGEPEWRTTFKANWALNAGIEGFEMNR